MTAMSSLPPTLPLPRQPSPLHFPALADSRRPSVSAEESNTSSSSLMSPHFAPRMVPLAPPAAASNPYEEDEANQNRLVPTDPLADSLVYRSTLTSLETSAITLKRLTKAVLAQAAVYTAMIEQMERAEDEFLGSLGELGKYLEGGYGIASDTWGTGGIRQLRSDEWKAKRAQLDGVLTSSVMAVKADLKRHGLAGGGAQDRYERSMRQYYSQTSDYLAQGAGEAGPSRHAQNPSASGAADSDAAQAARSAQFDLARYSHHSALLYSVPPSSVSCLDLLVNMYAWTSGLVGGQASQSRPAELKIAMGANLARLADLRAELLQEWAVRNAQTTKLEHETRLTNPISSSASSAALAIPPVRASGSVSPGLTSPTAHRPHRGGKMHKIQQSVGGKLRDLLGSGSGNHGTHHHHHHHGRHNKRTPSPGRGRASMDDPNRTEGMGIRRTTQSASSSGRQDLPPTPLPLVGTSLPHQLPSSGLLLSPTLSDDTAHRSPTPDQDSIDGYPAIALGADLFPLSLSGTPELPENGDGAVPRILPRRSVSAESRIPAEMVMGVGGVNGGADEDERREAVGTKREGVLWGAGIWEDLGKTGSKLKWEKLWVVLDRSRIYEYRDTDLNRPESAHIVIDLKFASVREGRGTDRRFVFEIVTPSQGRRLYQATSTQEMKEWLYAIANAIESCINGTSTVRTFDTSKLRTASGALDDHALPVRTAKLFPGLQTRAGTTAVPPMTGTAGDRRSLPVAAIPTWRPGDSIEAPKRNRRTSLRHALRQGAGIANERWNSVIGAGAPGAGHRPSFDGPRPPFLAPTNRQDSHLSASTIESSGMASPTVPHTIGTDISPVSSRTRPEEANSVSCESASVDGEIEKRVMEMAGLGLGISPAGGSSGSGTRRIISEAPPRTIATSSTLDGMSRSRSADMRLDEVAPTSDSAGLPAEAGWDMALLRRIVDLPGNAHCADCGKSMRSSRWASISLREVPMVIFICIRCCGQHRSLGTHISKPRSVDLDTWSPQTIKLASEWGNERANAIWEKQKDPATIPNDQDIGDYIRAKYVEGRWLSSEDRERFKLLPV